MEKMDTMRRLMHTYYKAAGVGLLYFDSQLNMVTAYPETLAARQIGYLCLDRLLSFLAEEFSKTTPHETRYYTYFFTIASVATSFFSQETAVILEPLLLSLC